MRVRLAGWLVGWLVDWLGSVLLYKYMCNGEDVCGAGKRKFSTVLWVCLSSRVVSVEWSSDMERIWGEREQRIRRRRRMKWWRQNGRTTTRTSCREWVCCVSVFVCVLASVCKSIAGFKRRRFWRRIDAHIFFSPFLRGFARNVHVMSDVYHRLWWIWWIFG